MSVHHRLSREVERKRKASNIGFAILVIALIAVVMLVARLSVISQLEETGKKSR
jgi:hypothetical protein